MLSAIEVLREGETEGLWRKCCSLRELSLEDFFVRVSDSLTRAYDPFQKLIGDALVSWVNMTSDCSRALYFGRSNGDFLIELGLQNCRVCNRDSSGAVLMKARLLKESMSPKNVEFREWDLEKGLTLYPENVFDYVLSIHTLPSLRDSDTAVREYFRVLKPSGGIILAEPPLLNKHCQILDFNKEQLRSKLEAAGFRINSMTYFDSALVTTALKPGYYFEMGGYKFLSAESREDLEKVFRLRYQVYCLELGVEPRNDEGLQKDRYDESGVHFLALDENHRTVGTLRAVPNNPGGYPMESDFPLTAYMRANGMSKAIDVGRFAIASSVPREDRAAIAFGLFKSLFEYCEDSGIKHVFTLTQLKLAKKYAFSGFRQIGEPFEYPGPLSGVSWIPMHCDIREAYKNYLDKLAEDSDMQGQVSTGS